MHDQPASAARVIALFGGERAGSPARVPMVAAAENVSREQSAAVRAFIGAVSRLEDVVDLETQTLQERQPADLNVFNDRKSQGLLELTRAMRALGGDAMRPEAASRLQALRSKLERNSALLRTHLTAVQEVSAMMADAMRDADSDGTYTAFRRSVPL